MFWGVVGHLGRLDPLGAPFHSLLVGTRGVFCLNYFHRWDWVLGGSLACAPRVMSVSLPAAGSSLRSLHAQELELSLLDLLGGIFLTLVCPSHMLVDPCPAERPRPVQGAPPDSSLFNSLLCSLVLWPSAWRPLCLSSVCSTRAFSRVCLGLPPCTLPGQAVRVQAWQATGLPLSQSGVRDLSFLAWCALSWKPLFPMRLWFSLWLFQVWG